MNLGIVFQLIDDALDYSAKTSNAWQTGETIFEMEKLPCPLLFWRFGAVLMMKNALLAAHPRRIDQTNGDLGHAIDLMTKHGALDDTVERARHYGAIARDAMGIFEDRPENKLFSTPSALYRPAY